MKMLVFSDLHGDDKGAERMEKAIEKYSPERILLLGDLLDGSEGKTLKVIRRYSGFILAVRGNCDRAYEEETMNIPLPEHNVCTYEGHDVHMQHHPPYPIAYPPGDIVLFGHTHVKELYSEKGVIYMNPGSISYPRDGRPSYGLFDGDILSLRDGDSGETLKSLAL